MDVLAKVFYWKENDSKIDQSKLSQKKTCLVYFHVFFYSQNPTTNIISGNPQNGSRFFMEKLLDEPIALADENFGG